MPVHSLQAPTGHGRALAHARICRCPLHLVHAIVRTTGRGCGARSWQPHAPRPPVVHTYGDARACTLLAMAPTPLPLACIWLLATIYILDCARTCTSRCPGPPAHPPCAGCASGHGNRACAHDMPISKPQPSTAVTTSLNQEFRVASGSDPTHMLVLT